MDELKEKVVDFWEDVILMPREVVDLVMSGLKWTLGKLIAIGVWFMAVIAALDVIVAEFLRQIWVMLFDSPESLLMILGVMKGLWPLAVKLFAAILSFKVAVIIPALIAIGWAGIIVWTQIKQKVELMKRRRWRKPSKRQV